MEALVAHDVPSTRILRLVRLTASFVVGCSFCIDLNAHERDREGVTDAELDALVEQAQQLLRGVGPQELRDSQALRQEVVTGIARVQTQLDHWLTDRPRRNVVRQRRAS